MEPVTKIEKTSVYLDDKVGDMILLMHPSQFAIYQQDPEKFIAYLHKTGKLPEPPVPKKPVQAMMDAVKTPIKRLGRSKQIKDA